MTTDPTPPTHERLVRRTVSGRYAVYDPPGGEDDRIASALSLEDAELLAHGRGELERLRECLVLTSTHIKDGQPCWCGANAVHTKFCNEARAALAGRAAGGEGP